jgi:hypothetical protein
MEFLASKRGAERETCSFSCQQMNVPIMAKNKKMGGVLYDVRRAS